MMQNVIMVNIIMGVILPNDAKHYNAEYPYGVILLNYAKCHYDELGVILLNYANCHYGEYHYGSRSAQ